MQVRASKTGAAAAAKRSHLSVGHSRSAGVDNHPPAVDPSRPPGAAAGPVTWPGANSRPWNTDRRHARQHGSGGGDQTLSLWGEAPVVWRQDEGRARLACVAQEAEQAPYLAHPGGRHFRLGVVLGEQIRVELLGRRALLGAERLDEGATQFQVGTQRFASRPRRRQASNQWPPRRLRAGVASDRVRSSAVEDARRSRGSSLAFRTGNLLRPVLTLRRPLKFASDGAPAAPTVLRPVQPLKCLRRHCALHAERFLQSRGDPGGGFCS